MRASPWIAAVAAVLGLAWAPAAAAQPPPPPNAKPVLTPIPDQNATEGQLLTFIAVAVDLNLDPVTYSLTPVSQVPVGATIDPSTGVFRWTPAESQGPGLYTFFVAANDDKPGPGPKEEVTITVFEVNAPPVIDDLPDRADALGDTVAFVATSTDPDIPENTLTYSATNLPPGIFLSPATGHLAGTPSAVGDYLVTVSVVDDGQPPLTDVTTFSWTVQESEDPGPDPDANDPPVLDPIADRHSIVGDTISFRVSASDGDGEPLAFSASGLPPSISIEADGTIHGTLAQTAAGGSPHTVTVTVSDPRGGSDSAGFTWTVQPAGGDDDPEEPDPGEDGDEGGEPDPPAPGDDGDAGAASTGDDNDTGPAGDEDPTGGGETGLSGTDRGESTSDVRSRLIESRDHQVSARAPEGRIPITRLDAAPVRDLAVGFAVAAEILDAQAVPTLVLVALITFLAIAGIDRGTAAPRRRRQPSGPSVK